MKEQSLFSECAAEHTVHMEKEELVLFPFIRKMVQAKQEGSQAPSSVFGKVQNPIRQMMLDHDTEGVRFLQIRQLTGNYSAPADACTTYRLTYDLLQAFENDLHLHIHLEKQYSFPESHSTRKRIACLT